MSGVADIPAHAPCGPFQRLCFAEHIERVNRGEQIQRAAGRRVAMAAGGEECRQSRPAPAARYDDTPRLAEVSPVAQPAGYAPVRQQAVITIQQLLPIGSIIDVTV
ncbi:MAG: hypothetical protein ACIAQU_02650 [Phycisphaerales bacterium JB064]